MLRITGFLGFAHQSVFYKNRELKVSEAKSDSFFRWKESPAVLGSLETANINHKTTSFQRQSRVTTTSF
jgi:hypothetical protein